MAYRREGPPNRPRTATRFRLRACIRAKVVLRRTVPVEVVLTQRGAGVRSAPLGVRPPESKEENAHGLRIPRAQRAGTRARPIVVARKNRSSQNFRVTRKRPLLEEEKRHTSHAAARRGSTRERFRQ